MTVFMRSTWYYFMPPWLQRAYRLCEELLSSEYIDLGWGAPGVRDIDHQLDEWIRLYPAVALSTPNQPRPRMERIQGMLGELHGEMERIERILEYQGAEDFARRVLYRALTWKGADPPNDLVFNDRVLNSRYPPSLRAYFGPPMQYFTDRLFLPVATILDQRISGTLNSRGQLLTLPASERHGVVLIVRFVYRIGAPSVFRLNPGSIMDMWYSPQTMGLEEAQWTPPEQEGQSGATVIMGRLRGNPYEVRFSVFQQQVAPVQARIRGVGVFPLVHVIPGVDLSRYQIFEAGKMENWNVAYFKHCLIWSLELAGIAKETVDSIASRIPGRCVTLTRLSDIFRDVRLRVEVTYAENSNWHRLKLLVLGGPADACQSVQLGLVENHVFLNELCSVSLLYIRNCMELAPQYIGWTNLKALDHGVPSQYYDAPVTTSFDVVNLIYHTPGLLRFPDMYEVTEPFRKTLLLGEFDDQRLEFDSRISSREITSEAPEPKDPPSLWFGDFETFVDGEHVPYLLCYGPMEGEIKALDCASSTGSETEALKAAVLEMVQEVGEGIVYFHNLSYDGIFIINAIRPIEDSIVEQGSSRLLAFKVRIRGKITEFRDSLALMPFPLRSFPAMLGVSVEKEVMPYKAYDAMTYKIRLPVERILEDDQTYTAEELQEAAQRAKAINAEGIHMWAYAVYYCVRDVEVLREGFKRMDAMMFEATGQHLWTKLTAPSLAFNSLRLKGVFDGCYELCGVPANMIRKTVVGGRCMLARNQKQDVARPVADFDAVSLYPSAMAELYTLKGLPKVMTVEDIVHFRIRREGWDAFFVEIRIEEVGRELDFPLITYKGKGNRTFCNDPGVMWVNDITLDDLVEFHNIRYTILQGYYFNEGKNFRLKEVIRELFDLRLEAKKKKQAIEVIYKLLMNSCYGKTIMKPRTTRKNVYDKEQLHRYMQKSPNVIMSYQKLANGNYLVRDIVDVLENWSMPSLGSHILAMSKRIVTRVTSLAQELGIGVYYTDTDSIHIDRDAVGTLAEAFQLRYGKALIGKDLGQFHTDFPVTSRGMMWSSRFIGVGKKSYIDLLTDGEEERLHIRMKGIPEASIHKACERRGLTVVEMFERFLTDPTFEMPFDLADAKPCFDRKSDFTIATMDYFVRSLKFA